MSPALAPQRIAWAYQRLRAYLYERPLRKPFATFVSSQVRDSRTLVMFFTSGLLHFVCKNLEFVPAGVPLVLIGAGLTPGERDWIVRHIDRPFHHVGVHVDDRVIWELLFDTMGGDFGWLDADCFVQNPRLFAEMFQFDPDVAVNCAWSYRTRGDHRMLCTHLVTLQHAILRRVRAAVSVSPTTYSFEPRRRSHYRHGCTRPATRSQVRLIGRLLPQNGEGRPIYPSQIPEKGNLPFFDTLTVYQLCAEALGYRLHAVRDLRGTHVLDEHFSDEVIHINGASYYQGWKTSTPRFRAFYRLLLQFDYLLLRSQVARLPDDYVGRLARLQHEVAALQLPRQQLGRDVREFFHTRGVSDQTLTRDEWAFLR